MSSLKARTSAAFCKVSDKQWALNSMMAGGILPPSLHLSLSCYISSIYVNATLLEIIVP